MSFDLTQLAEVITQHGPVARVVVADTAGSTPREVGASMLVWPGGQSGTIGGGELEYRAVDAARSLLAGDRKSTLNRMPLGPALGQCCGGAVTLLTECYSARDTARLAQDGIVARPVTPTDIAPLAVKRVLDRVRAQGVRPAPQLMQDWMIEPLAQPTTPVWIFGAGHVGRAIIDVLAPLPDLAITWVDTTADRFPTVVPAGVTALPAANPAAAAALAPSNAHHLVLTYSHNLDLELCHAILSGSFASAGLIGSATKWARFQKRLAALGHSAAQINRIQCPIGDPGLGKAPQAIAVGVASALLKSAANNEKTNRGTPGDRRFAPSRRAIDT
ncbi:xanthine dehydrogenase accessory protein XdhC [Aliiroseovarius sp. S1339]|uniref:xanthine dehydrogenase accessory protein XdhC n=1 Tax=Aliiroseovarius sp. S1339 TaxID=2936990 RepID=UPI0020C0D440|nr:xanthine dehydrogenase accessory protein XdhC [Aliiroseovarius sp. S1339]MCK8464251.1 xanthine dehydrogenase accessory protein XdhC [Aliiroseovarius sp. S1339]